MIYNQSTCGHLQITTVSEFSPCAFFPCSSSGVILSHTRLLIMTWALIHPWDFWVKCSGVLSSHKMKGGLLQWWVSSTLLSTYCVCPLLTPQQGRWYRVLGITALLCPFLFFCSRKQLFTVYTRPGRGNNMILRNWLGSVEGLANPR